MQTGLQNKCLADLAILTMRVDGTRRAAVADDTPVMGDVDFSDPAAVEAARSAILQLSALDEFVGWAFEDDGDEARGAIAVAVLCEKAAVWQQANDGKPVAEGLSQDAMVGAKAKVFSLLSTQGLQAMTADYKVVGDGIRYTPDTGNVELDDLLSMVVTEAVIKALREHTPRASETADTLDQYASIFTMRKRSRAKAKRWEEAAQSVRAERQFDMAAVAEEKAADAWMSGDRPVMAAVSYKQAASDWLTAIDRWGVHQYPRAARASKKAAAAWQTAGYSNEAALAYDREAKAWESNSDHARAAQAYEMAAAVRLDAGRLALAGQSCGLAAAQWDDARQPVRSAQASVKQAVYLGRAADELRKIGQSELLSSMVKSQARAWQAAGFPERAAQAWKSALLDVGAETIEADEVVTEAEPLFGISLDEEQTLED